MIYTRGHRFWINTFVPDSQPFLISIQNKIIHAEPISKAVARRILLLEAVSHSWKNDFEHYFGVWENILFQLVRRSGLHTSVGIEGTRCRRGAVDMWGSRVSHSLRRQGGFDFFNFLFCFLGNFWMVLSYTIFFWCFAIGNCHCWK